MSFLMLWPDKTEPLPQIISRYYSDLVTVESLYRPCGRVARAIRKTLSKRGASTRLFFAPWIDHLDDFDVVLIHANPINVTVPQVLRRDGYRGRIIYWYWNPVARCVDPGRVDRSAAELWSFDAEDCARYGMRSNTQYYFGRMDVPSPEIKCDAFFIGQDKGRAAEVTALRSELEGAGLVCDFRIIRDATSDGSTSYADRMPYFDVIERIRASRAVIDIVQKGQTGLTLRALESVFLGRKLVTGNIDIMKEPFYNPRNIFILGVDDRSELAEFIRAPYMPVDDSILKDFDFASWLSRFFMDDGEASGDVA